jgi:hypothetical protein
VDCAHPRRAIKPVGCFAAREVEIAVSLREHRVGTEPLQLAVDRFELDGHSIMQSCLGAAPVTAVMPLRFASTYRFLAAREILTTLGGKVALCGLVRSSWRLLRGSSNPTIHGSLRANDGRSC